MKGINRILIAIVLGSALGQASLLKRAEGKVNGNDQCFQILFKIGDEGRETISDILHFRFDEAMTDLMSLLQDIKIAFDCLKKNAISFPSLKSQQSTVALTTDRECFVDRLNTIFNDVSNEIKSVLNGNYRVSEVSIQTIITRLRQIPVQCN